MESKDNQFGGMSHMRKDNPIKVNGPLPNCVNCKGVLDNGFYGDYNYCDDCVSDLETRAEDKGKK